MKKIAAVMFMFITVTIYITAHARVAVYLQAVYNGEDQNNNNVWLKEKNNTVETKTGKEHRCMRKFRCDHFIEHPDEEPELTKRCKNTEGSCKVEYVPQNHGYKNPYLLTLKKGKFYYNDKLYNTKTACDSMVLQGKYVIRNAGKPEAIWVMDLNGNLYVAPMQLPGHFNHSSILGGKPVICAGEIIIEDGIITLINNQSGHYIPPGGSLDDAVVRLRDQGCLVDKNKVEYFVNEDPQKSKIEKIDYVHYTK